jgi:transposase
LEELASRFLVSVGWAKKISAQRNRNGQAERIRHQPGRKPHAGIEAQQKVMAWVSAKPDLTLSEIQMKLSAEAGVKLSLPQIWHLLRKLGLRLKKSRSMPASEIRKPTASSAKSSSRISARSRRSG